MTIYILYSVTGADSITSRLGHAEYSYYFVREAFRKMLEKHGTVIVASEPEREVDEIYDKMRAKGLDCLFFSFCAPHTIVNIVRCPMIPVFAWEFDTIPTEVWDNNPNNDWRVVLSRAGLAITHSQYGAVAVRNAMGDAFPIASIPSPVWNNFQSREGVPHWHTPSEVVEFHFSGSIVDSLHFEPTPLAIQAGPLSALNRLRVTGRYGLAWYRDVIRELLPAKMQGVVSRVGVRLHALRALRRRAEPATPPPEITASVLSLEGYIFLSVLNPIDGRKNWQDMITAFCSALRSRPDATLLLKFIHVDRAFALDEVRNILAKLTPFRCRVVVVNAFLSHDDYRRLLRSSTFVVNSSLAEGQCLPLMEAMSCGTPAISPRHTGMADYIDDSVGFVVRANQEICCWPHDTRQVFRAKRYRIDWQSLTDAFADAYRTATENSKRYQQMSEAAVERMQDYCSEQAVYEKLEFFLERALTIPESYSSSAALSHNASAS